MTQCHMTSRHFLAVESLMRGVAVMPSRTFFGLSAGKQRKIIQAARTVFAAAPYTEVTIADIVNLAEIPRGSFYQYFTDKEDLYLYLLKTFMDDFQAKFLSNLVSLDGDLFATFRLSLQQTTAFLATSPDRGLLRNLFMRIDYHDFQKFSQRQPHQPPHPHHLLSKWSAEVERQTDFTKLRIDPDQFYLLFRMLLMILGHSMAHYFTTVEEQPEKASATFQQQYEMVLSWFEHGVALNSQGGNKDA